MPTATAIVLEYVCPLLGCLAANAMFAAPVKAVRQAVGRGTLGSLNPTPWAVMTGNCTGWVTYSYLIQNQFLFWANAPGLIISVWLNMAAAKLQYCDRLSASMRSSFVSLLDANRRSFILSPSKLGVLGEDAENDDGYVPGHPVSAQTFSGLRKMALEVTAQRIEAPAPHEKVVVGVVVIWVAVISLLSFLDLSSDQWKMSIGIIVNVNLCFFYGAPLSTIFTVLKTRDSSSIHKWTMLMNTANACFWTAFGFGVMDWFILVPNGLGALLGFAQMFLRLVVPARETSPQSGGSERKIEIENTPASATDTDVEATASDPPV